MNVPHPPRCLVLLLALVLAASTPGARAELQRYELDPVHTRVVFSVSHAGFSSAFGTVSGSTGTLYFDPDDWTTARLEARVPMGRVDLGDEQWNRATLASNLLDTDRYPEARFVSTSVEPLDGGRARIAGLLTLRGETREVVMEATLNALKRHPLPPFRRTAGFSATATLSRADFGITAWRSMIGDEVELQIEVEAVRARGGAGEIDEAGEAEEVGEVEVEQSADPAPGSPRHDDQPARQEPGQ